MMQLYPDLAALPGVARVETRPTFAMSNVYYDTPDLRLFRWGITLRRRSGGPDEGWHLKLPVQGAGEAGTAGVVCARGPADAVPTAPARPTPDKAVAALTACSGAAASSA